MNLLGLKESMYYYDGNISIAQKYLRKEKTKVCSFDTLYRISFENSKTVTRSKAPKDKYRFSVENLKKIAEFIKRPIGKFYIKT